MVFITLSNRLFHNINSTDLWIWDTFLLYVVFLGCLLQFSQFFIDPLFSLLSLFSGNFEKKMWMDSLSDLSQVIHHWFEEKLIILLYWLFILIFYKMLSSLNIFWSNILCPLVLISYWKGWKFEFFLYFIFYIIIMTKIQMLCWIIVEKIVIFSHPCIYRR